MSRQTKYHKGDIVSNPWTSSVYDGNRNYQKYFVFTSKGRNTISGFYLSPSGMKFEKTTFYIDGNDFKVVGHTKIIDQFKHEIDDIIDREMEENKNN